MPRMMGENRRKNVCRCIDCNGDGSKGRTAEKREWTREEFMAHGLAAAERWRETLDRLAGDD